MIRTNAEYEDALRRLRQDQEIIDLQRARLRELGLSPEEVEHALQPSLAFHAQLREETDAYEAMRRGDITRVASLTEIGRVLIALRIASGMTQKQLAERLGVSESQVSRDERNDYHGITVDRAQRIITALDGRIELAAQPAAPGYHGAALAGV